MKYELPQYLVKPKAPSETFGTLRKESTKAGVCWVVEGEPQVAVMAKRLFPGSQGKGAGIAKFPANRRTFAELVWFLQRWPLQILNPEEFERDYEETCQYVQRRAEFNAAPLTSKPSVLFKGDLKPFQQEGLTWQLQNERTLLADDMGLGKTVEALAAIATAPHWPALIVAQPHMVMHWEQKVAEFLETGDGDHPLFNQGKLTVHVIRGTPRTSKTGGVLPRADIYIVHYLLLAQWREELMRIACQRVVFDEVQELRHAGTAKYSAASELSTRADAVVGLSGTPFYNRAGELWNVINVIEYHALGDYDSFTREWCVGYGSDIVCDPDLFGAHLRREGLMLRRRKTDVLPDLPPKRRVVHHVESDDNVYRALVAEAVQCAKRAATISDRFERGREELRAVNSARQATGIAKAHHVASFVRGLMEADEPTIVFAHHHAVFDVLLDALAEYRPVCITGRQSPTEKWEAKEAFRTGQTNLILISLRSATGIDGLQERARVVVFGELDWSPAIHAQAEDRAYRIGVLDSVLCYYLVSHGGTDPDVQEALGLKIAQFVGVMADQEETDEDRLMAGEVATGHMRGILAKLRASVGKEPANQPIGAVAA
ncbi:MAG: DEAD/DEAH box helicase [Cupriavidus sp.]|nr:MAG: DEAD/DEAH box helicase [Cupriavidus sp.]